MSLESNHPSQPADGDSLPKAGTAGAPIFLIGLAALLAYLGMVYVGNHGGDFEPQVYAPYASWDSVSNDWPQVVEDPQIKMGREVFKNCAACHQANGQGMAGQFPPLAGSDWINNKSPNRIIRIVLNGLQGPLVVNGQPFPTAAAMLAWKANLSDEQIAAVLTYVRGKKDWGNNAPPVSPDEVKAIRAKLNGKDGYFAPDDLMKLGDKD
jgi:mono/diheme cytochrome c family protein